MSFEKAIERVLAHKSKPWPQHVNRISSIGEPCERKLYYNRAEWDKKAPFEASLLGIFETGNKLEPVIRRIVNEVGEASDIPFRIVGSNTPTKDDLLTQYQIHGTCDGFLQYFINGKWNTHSVVDIKTSSPNVFRTLRQDDASCLNRYSWTRHYKAQLSLYALANNNSRWSILFVNKANLYEMKLIVCDLDLDFAENLLKKAERINDAIEMSEPPPKINDPDECPRCEFASICLPEYSTGGNLKIVEDTDLEAALDRLQELKEVKAEIKELEKVRDVALVKGQDIALGNYLVTWNQIVSQYEAKEAYTQESWRKKIICRK